MARWYFRLFLVCAAVLLAANLSRAQEQEQEQEPRLYTLPLDLPAVTARWGGMTNAAFVQEVLDSYPERRAWERAVLNAYGSAADTEAARRVRQGGAYTAEDLPVIPKLMEIAATALTPEEQLAVQSRLATQLRTNQSASFAELEAVFDAQASLHSGLADRTALIKEWVTNRDLSQLSLPELSWCAQNAGRVWGYRNRGMQVRWTGTIRAPRDGQYTFSASPTQVQINDSDLVSEESTKIFIDDRLVSEASVAGITANPVALSANQPSSIRVEFNYKHSGSAPSASYPPAAMLFWQGPGVAKQLVPPAALAPPQERGAGPGLWGEYTSIQSNDPDNPKPAITAAGVDRQIDFLWNQGYSFLLRDRAAVDRVVAELVNRLTSAAYIADIRESVSFRTARLWAENAELMTSAQRARCLQALANDPELLRHMRVKILLLTLRAYRVGAEQDAISLLGNWAQVHAGDAPVPDENFFVHNRESLFEIAGLFTYGVKDGFVRLEDEYLALPNGYCNLPAAYLAAYSRACRGELDNWIALLDGQIAAQNLTGDQRASWLIARAQAEEIRGASPSRRRFDVFPERYHAGWEYLDEASLVAESEPVRFHIFMEKVARSLSIRPDDVGEMLNGAKQSFTGTDSVNRLAELEKFLAEHNQRLAEKEERQAQAGMRSYVRRLEKRKLLAEKANDVQAVARYNALIEAAQPSTPAPEITPAPE